MGIFHIVVFEGSNVSSHTVEAENPKDAKKLLRARIRPKENFRLEVFNEDYRHLGGEAWNVEDFDFFWKGFWPADEKMVYDECQRQNNAGLP